MQTKYNSPGLASRDAVAGLTTGSARSGLVARVLCLAGTTSWNDPKDGISRVCRGTQEQASASVTGRPRACSIPDTVAALKRAEGE